MLPKRSGAARRTVLDLTGPETKVVIGHSLGSVVAYEAAHYIHRSLPLLVTLGSPLGLHTIVYDRPARGASPTTGRMPTPNRLASTMALQLARSVPGFSAAQEVFSREVPEGELLTFGVLERRIIGPLKRLSPKLEIRLVVDALDCLSTGARGPVIAALEELAALPFIRLLLTSRPDTRLPQGALVYLLARAPVVSVQRYLAAREIPEFLARGHADAVPGQSANRIILAALAIDVRNIARVIARARRGNTRLV
jgi:pimeloyl-ACP methyl ester carboxylesterase